jgi:hypothetical protein
MKTLIKIVVVAAFAVTACGAPGNGGTGGGGGSGGGSGGMGGGSQTPECFMGTPATNDQLLNACVDQTVEKVLKQTTWRDPGVVLPALP